MVQGVNNLNLTNIEDYSSFVPNENIHVNNDLFPGTAISQDMELQALEDKLALIESENGCVLKAWDKVKSGLNVGVSSEKCEDAIDKYKNGEITFDEAIC